MPANHLHLIINHVPVIGSMFAMVVLAVGVLSGKVNVLKIALWSFVAVGLAAAAAYLTGEPAEHAIEGLYGVSETMLEAHEDLAMWALLLAGATGLVAVVGLLRYRLKKSVSSSLLILLIITGILTSAVMGWTALEGGKIRRPELRETASIELNQAPATPAESTLTT